MLKKGRAVFVRGEASGMAKLTAADVVAIRTSGTSNAITARKYGVSKGLIGAVRRRRIWRHVP
jgi:hypothetical protein